MIELGVIDSIIVLLIVFLFGIMTSAQKVIFKEDYSTIFDVVYYRSTKSLLKTFSYRTLVIILIYLLCNKIFKCNYNTIILGIGFAAFLQVWPAIINYRLISLRMNKNKLLYLLGCITYVIYCIVTGLITYHFLLPLLYGKKDVYLFENTGVQIIVTLFSYSFAWLVSIVFTREGKEKIFVNIETYNQELDILKTQMNLECQYVNLFSYEIKKYSEENSLNPNLLKAMLLLEYVNRGSYSMLISEILLCKLFPMLAIRRDISVGLAQIKISTAAKVLEMSPELFVRKLFKTDFNIYVCAKYIRLITEAYREEGPDVNYYEYLATEYLGLLYKSQNKTKMLYTAVLNSYGENEVFNPSCYF